MNFLQKWWRRKVHHIDFDGWKLCEFVDPVPVYSLPFNTMENSASHILNGEVSMAFVNFDHRIGRWFKVRHPDGWIHEADLNYERDRYKRMTEGR